MDVTQDSNIAVEEKQPKPPPIVADIEIPIREIQHLLGNDCSCKRTSIGTKIFPVNFEKYEFCKKAFGISLHFFMDCPKWTLTIS